MSDLGLYLDSEFNFEEKDDLSFEVTDGKTTGKDKKLTIIKVIFFLLLIVFAGELIAYRYVVPSFESPKVTISGNKIYSAEELAVKLLPMNATNWFNFDVDEAVSILSSESGIDYVTVEKQFPNKILINVKERIPVAFTFSIENGYSHPMQIDKNGVLFPVRDNSMLEKSSLPIVSGIPLEHMSEGMRIPTKYRPLIDQIANISTNKSSYFASISEICVIPKEFGNYELALIPSQSKIRVLTDRSLNEDALRYMMIVLDVVNLLDTDVSEVDLRYGSVSCKMNRGDGE
ncbi:MAG: FtsQ-type POTRA domain-containing protein [Treponema sp.]|nr:FtsQ-type POTRA domain-containing protein [Treponema sp.]